MKRFYIKTLGCDKNTVDSECLAGLLINSSMKETKDPEKADFLIVNTCGFILDAKVQSIDAIFELASVKTDRQKLIVCGCLSQRYFKELEKEMPEVDYFFGVDDYLKMPGVLLGKTSERMNVGPCSKTFVELSERKTGKSFSAYIKIAEGCANVCSYCSIPFMKGRYRSRSEEAVLNEAKALADAGVKELNVIAQDITYYGLDRKDGSSLAGLLHKLCKIGGIEWIRLLYCYENEITDELIECMKSEPKICHYIDIPIQHCNTQILKSMNRRSSHSSIEKTIGKLRKAMPDICIRTTLIVGFPGETKEQFNELYDFVNETEFERLGAFTYSREDGTRAAKMPGQVRKDVKERRRDKIMELQREISLEHNQELIGKVVRVLVEEKEEDGIYNGRSYMDAPEIDNSIMFKGPKSLKPGDFVDVLINDAFDYDLVGETVK